MFFIKIFNMPRSSSYGILLKFSFYYLHYIINTHQLRLKQEILFRKFFKILFGPIFPIFHFHFHFQFITNK